MMTKDPEVAVIRGGDGTVSVVVSRHEGTADLRFSVAAGHVPVGARERVVEEALQVPGIDRARLTASLPVGDAVLLAALVRQRPHARVHAAGATCVVQEPDVERS